MRVKRKISSKINCVEQISSLGIPTKFFGHFEKKKEIFRRKVCNTKNLRRLWRHFLRIYFFVAPGKKFTKISRGFFFFFKKTHQTIFSVTKSVPCEICKIQKFYSPGSHDWSEPTRANVKDDRVLKGSVGSPSTFLSQPGSPMSPFGFGMFPCTIVVSKWILKYLMKW